MTKESDKWDLSDIEPGTSNKDLPLEARSFHELVREDCHSQNWVISSETPEQVRESLGLNRTIEIQNAITEELIKMFEKAGKIIV